MEFLDKNGVSIMWNKIKDNFLSTSGGTIYDNQTITFREIPKPGPMDPLPVNQKSVIINGTGINFASGTKIEDGDGVDVSYLGFLTAGAGTPLFSRITNTALDAICV